jgi:GDP-L-fucose synthase
MNRVLVTGGTGLVGSAIRVIKPDWIYLGSKDCDMSCKSSVKQILQQYKPDTIIHLAANVGGLFKNTAHRLDMFNTNLIINYNVLQTAFELGIKRVICCLSTCIFPDGLNRVLTESCLHLGEPHSSNYGYAYAKRIMEVQCRLYSETPDYHYQCVIPTNIYGPNDNFNLEDSHVIPGLIHKAYLHSQINNDESNIFTILGSGLPKRQFIYSTDLAKIIVRLIENSVYEPLLICSTPESDETNIISVARLIAKEFGISRVEPSDKIDSQNDGQKIKTASPARLLELMPDFSFTNIETGIHQTVEWFKNNYPYIRK